MFSRADNVGNEIEALEHETNLGPAQLGQLLLVQLREVGPPTCTVPESNESSPDRQCSSVDFPEPDGPMMVLNRPDSKATETPSSAHTVASRMP